MPEPIPGDTFIDLPGASEMPANMDYWQERLYKGADNYDADAKFFENALKSAHLEGKMSAREMTFAKGGGLPTLAPLGSTPTPP